MSLFFEKKGKMVKKKKLFFISYFCIGIVLGCIFISNIMSQILFFYFLCFFGMDYLGYLVVFCYDIKFVYCILVFYYWDCCCIKDGEEECECVVYFFYNVIIVMFYVFLSF